MTDTLKPSVKKPTPEQIKKRREAAKTAVAVLTDAFPEIFDLDNAKPLKIGIHHDLAAGGVLSKTQIRKALSAYTRHYHYLSAVAKGGVRYDLKGVTEEAVKPEEMSHAQEQVDAIDKVRNERKAQHDVRKKRKAQQNERDARLSTKLEALLAKTNS